MCVNNMFYCKIIQDFLPFYNGTIEIILLKKLCIYNISKMVFEVDKIHYIYSLCWFPQNVKINIRYTYNKYK